MCFQVPYVFVMVVLTLVPTLPACIYFLGFQQDITAEQQALQIPMLVLVLACIYFGCAAVRCCTTGHHCSLCVQFSVLDIQEHRPSMDE
jgi:hypothetical protein